MGPVDGHNLEELIATFEQAHQHTGPVLVHATVKGRGMRSRTTKVPAQSSSISPLVKPPPLVNPSPGYSKVFAHTLVKLAENDPKIIGITAAMATGTGLDKLRPSCPNNTSTLALLSNML